MDQAWWEIRAERFRKTVKRLREQDTITVVQPFAPINRDDSEGIIILHSNHSFILDNEKNNVDIYFNQGYSHNIDDLWKVIKTGRSGVNVCWFWDNHHLIASSMHAAMLADANFWSHSFESDYLKNELSVHGGLVALAPVYWTATMVEEVATEKCGQPRSNALYGGYNSYPNLNERNAFLHACQAAIPDNVIKIWPLGMTWDEHPYYLMSREDRLREWFDHKVALCVSFGINTTIRMFDSLLAGQIPIVVGRIHDLDTIIPPALQESLPILKVESQDPERVRDAYHTALARFDEEGEEGVRRRSQYILDNHMPRNRVMQMVKTILELEV